MEVLVVAVVGLLTIAFSTSLAPRLRVAAPLLLVVVGAAISLLPMVPDVAVDPEWVLEGVLPPLLYATAVSTPAMDFRRDLRVISGMSIGLVVLSAVALGFLFHAVVPGLPLAAGIALGAIVSPTDAVATSIVREVGVSPRLTAILEGESLLNDATALAVLRSAVAVTVLTSVEQTAGDVLWDFVRSLVLAGAIGWVVGAVNLRVRARVTQPTVNTVISFTVPFLASVPASMLDASGLVAAVVAGLVTGHGAPRYLAPSHRASDRQTWRTIELARPGRRTHSTRRTRPMRRVRSTRRVRPTSRTRPTRGVLPMSRTRPTRRAGGCCAVGFAASDTTSSTTRRRRWAGARVACSPGRGCEAW